MMYFPYWLVIVSLISRSACNPMLQILDDGFEDERLVSDLSLESQSDEAGMLQFSALGQKYSVKLQRADSLFSPDYGIERISTANRTIVDIIQDSTPGNFYTEIGGSGSYYVEVIDGQTRVDGIVDDTLRISNVNGVHKAIRIVNKRSEHKIENDQMLHNVFRYGKEYQTKITNADVPPLPEEVTVEVHAIIDQTLEKKLKEKNLPIEKYLGILWNYVQSKYRAISNPRVAFSITKSYILPEFDWINDAIIPGTTNVLFGKKFMGGLGQWLYSELTDKQHFPFDIAIVHTGLDLGDTSDNGLYTTNELGLAPVAGLCMAEGDMIISIGVMEDLDPSLDYESVVAVAHEIAHLFGVNHDNELPKELHCPLHYLMYFALGSDTIPVFSNCSLQIISEHLHKDQTACVRNPAAPEVIPMLTPEPDSTKTL